MEGQGYRKTKTVKLRMETKERLVGLREYRRETYNEIIEKVLQMINICIENPIAGARMFREVKRKRGLALPPSRSVAHRQTRASSVSWDCQTSLAWGQTRLDQTCLPPI